MSFRFLSPGMLMICLLPYSQLFADNEIQAGSFLQQLQGRWHGQAVTTPVGPRPYNIRFKWLEERCLQGTADTGASLHRWTFCEQENEIHLKFLSNFSGNRTEIHFKTVGQDNNFMALMADSHPFMKLKIQSSGTSRTILIYHRHKLHVEIQLNSP